MSFRVRVFALILLVAVAATAATAWLTLRQATRQVQESAAADRQDVARITDELLRYGQTHGTWDGVAGTVRTLARDTGQRIRISSDPQGQLADSDALLGREPRPGGTAPPLLVDPRPEPAFPDWEFFPSVAKVTASGIGDYVAGVTYAACLTRAGHEVTVSPGDFGVPVFTDAGKDAGKEAGKQAGGAARAGACVKEENPSKAAFTADIEAVNACASELADARIACLRRTFAERTAAVAPQPLTVHLGALDDAGQSLAVGPTVAVSAGVAAAVLACALLLSRAVLRPVRALTDASRGLGEGDLGRRVPSSGKDEIGELGRSFNRMADSLQASEERQRRLVGDIAHELRTPLANLRGYLEALRDGVLRADAELLDSLHEEVLLQQRIVDDLQDLALAEAGVLTYHRGELDARELIEACRTAHSALASAAGVRLDTVATGPVPLHGDPGRLRQALSNLVGNAVRHTAPGGSVRLELAERDETVRITVRDTGSGIAAADLPHLFDRFWRADAARGRATGGSGLGLSIARQIVADHHGTIEVASEVGVGTAFTVVLPAAQRHL
ncbi:HAMP domain-containing protein [Streptomyces sp. ISL-36]|uniref:sensor histidine kinase n=1 Tax=Streptomyces sp. ISL-36 TaxID=2819182 RepID=UPI001BE53063|nr:ATP-binding protein [Streptomyces sp. ISL-36]MBT2438816.1 HAMP domain-containing protein [Streptomyces sp. ISL-36]